MRYWIDVDIKDMDIRGKFLSIHLEGKSISVEIKDIIKLLKLSKIKTCLECMGQPGELDDKGLPIVFTSDRNLCRNCNNKKVLNKRRRDEPFKRIH